MSFPVLLLHLRVLPHHLQIGILGIQQIVQLPEYIQIGIGTELHGRHLENALEETAEIALVEKAQYVAYLLNGLVGVAQQIERLHGQTTVNDVLGGDTHSILHHLGQILGSDTQMVGIENHPMLGTEIESEQMEETAHQRTVCHRRRWFWMAGLVYS